MIVLDTHVWIWWAAGARKLTKRARVRIESAERILVPAICAWEVAMLVDRRRLELDRPVLTWLRQAIDLPAVELAPLTPEVAVRAAGLGGGFPGDPADRLIVATALEHRGPLVTMDERLRNSGIVESIG